jgi:transposase
MKSQSKTKSESRKHYSNEFKQQALIRAERDGVAVAARELGLKPEQIYGWRSANRQRSQEGEVQRLEQAEFSRLKREVARLEEENAFLKKAAAYFAKDAKRGTP